MNTKIKLILILAIPIIFIGSWLYILISFLHWNPSNKLKAEITNQYSTNKSTKNQKSINKISAKNHSINTWWKNINTEKNKKLNIIKVYIPSRFNLIWRKKIKKNLLKQKILVKIVSYPYNTKKILKDLALKKIDIALINTDDNEKLYPLSYKIKLWKNLDTFINFIFYDYISWNYINFIPYCIDPLVSLVKKNINIPNTNPKTIINYFFKNVEKIWPLTINFWISSLITKLFLEKNLYPSEIYKYNLYSFLLITNFSKDINFLKTIINWTDTKNIKLFDTKKYLKYKSILSKKNTICKYNYEVCLVKYKITKISFIPLSLMNLTKTNYYKIYLFPTNSSNIYPVLWWNFLVNKKSKNIIPALKFINEYIKQWLNYNYQLRNNCLSAFNNIYEKQKTNPKYTNIITYEENFFLLKNTSYKIEKLLKNTKILEVFKNSYSIEGFFDNFDIWNYLY